MASLFLDGLRLGVRGGTREKEAVLVAHWKRIRTTNVLEQSFREVWRRVREVGRFQDETRAVAMVYALLHEAQAGWRHLTMTPEAQRTLTLPFPRGWGP